MFDTDDERGPAYGLALMSTTASAFFDNNINNCKLVHVLVDSDASGHYFDESFTPELRRRLLDYMFITMRRKRFSIEGVRLNGTEK